MSASRQILETITEETSEDEENSCLWSQYEQENNVWSSESETGSVIRMEVHNGGFSFANLMLIVVFNANREQEERNEAEERKRLFS